jgi:Sfi1 spindle body protein
MEMLRHYMSTWNAKFQNIVRLQDIANEMRIESDSELAYEALATWLERHQFLAENNQRAERHYDVNVTRFQSCNA